MVAAVPVTAPDADELGAVDGPAVGAVTELLVRLLPLPAQVGDAVAERLAPLTISGFTGLHGRDLGQRLRAGFGDASRLLARGLRAGFVGRCASLPTNGGLPVTQR